MEFSARLRSAAFELLARREHSGRELAGKLAARFQLPVADPAIQQCLQAMVDGGYQSDERFAEVFVRSRRARGYGPVFIEQELRRRGVSADLVEAAVNRADDSWTELAAEQRRKRFGSGSLTALRERVKVDRFLRARGFLSSHIRDVL